MNFDKDKKDLLYDENILDSVVEDDGIFKENKEELNKSHKKTNFENNINKADKYYDELTYSLNKYSEDY